ncbi:HtaA domain-containing protein [Conexibacter arvalis]|uniref:Htaa domain-containing protein n=1 Tax=Conexibacter arvalis TaxID=912552 RepID=A0A840IK05_9ACTN|nr:HtaA domain-containing protein [Conexibacter arvalis]MBB4665059.1 hypothetical protein [Conexibacter arvalis]
MAVAAGAAALAMAAAPGGAAAAPGWTGPAPLPASEAAPYPSVALDADGTATALWLQNRGEQSLKAATKPAGGSWSQPVTLPGSYATSLRAQLAVAPDGSATAVWRNDDRIQAATRGADGTWSAVETISAAGESPSSAPALTLDADGTATAAWGQGCAVIVSTLPARSDTWANPRAIFTVPTEPACGASTAGFGTVSRPPAIGSDRAGNVTVVWRTGSTLSSSVKAIRSSVRTGGARGSWSAPKLVAEPPARVPTNQYEPELVVDVDGRAVVAWPVDTAGGGGGGVATRPAGTDEPWDAAIEPLPSSATATPAVALDGHGRASVVWDVAQDGAAPPAVKLATVSASGAWSAPETVATLPADAPAFAPRLTLDDDGGALVAWSRAGSAGAAVEAARRPAGGAWSAVRPLAADAPPRTIVGLAGDPLGDATVVWPVGAEAGDPSDTSSIDALASAHHVAEPALRTEWSGRADPSAGSLRSWVRYLYTFWPSPIPGVPDGAGFVELSDGASWPDPEDRFSWRWGQSDAWRDVTTGELVVEQQGTLRWAMPSHGIDIRFVNPTLRVAADGRIARLISDGSTSGSMEDAMAGRVTSRPFDDLHVLDVDLARGGHRDGAVSGRRSWIGAPATMTSIAGQTLGVTYAGGPFGRLTFSVPATVPDREPPRPPVDNPPVGEPGSPTDQPRPPAPGPPGGTVKRPVLRAVRAARLNRSGVATVATVACPRGGGACRVRVPRTIRVRVAGRRYGVRLLAPKTVRAGRRAAVRVRLSRAARTRLAGRRLAIRFTLRASVRSATVRRTIRVRVKVPRTTAGRSARDRR